MYCPFLQRNGPTAELRATIGPAQRRGLPVVFLTVPDGRHGCLLLLGNPSGRGLAALPPSCAAFPCAMRGRGYDIGAGFLGDDVDPEVITGDDDGRREDSLVAADSSSVVPNLFLSLPSQLTTNPVPTGLRRHGCLLGHSFFLFSFVTRLVWCDLAIWWRQARFAQTFFFLAQLVFCFCH
jgi:hypothetical protein